MSLARTDIKLYASASMPTDDTTSSGGAIDTGTEIDDSSIGEFFPIHPIDAASNTTWYYKGFIKNDNATDNLTSVAFYIKNLLLDVPSAGVVSVVSDSSSDNSTKRVRLIGLNNSATPVVITEDITLNGTTSVTSTYSFSELYRVELRNDTSPYPLVNSAGNITITRGTDLGIIPYDSINDVGCNGATGEIEIALSSELDDTEDTTNRLTAPYSSDPTPVALTFSKPNSSNLALSCVDASQELGFGEAQGFWLKLTSYAGIEPSPDMPVLIWTWGLAS